MSKRSLLALVPAAVSAVLWAAPARADYRAAQAQAAFEEGRRLEEAGDYAGAIASFETSENLDPALGTRLNLAACYERAGRLASAWRAFSLGADEAHAAGEERRAARAHLLADALRARLSSIAVVPQPGLASDTVVRIDGAPIDRARWGEAQPIDGGDHKVEAKAPGRIPWEIHVTVAREAEHATVTVPVLQEQPRPTPILTPAPAPAKEPEAPVMTRRSEGSPSWGPMRIAGVATAGVGLVGIGAGFVFGSRARARWDDRQAQCPADVCTPVGQAFGEDAKSAAVDANWAFAIGGALVATGTVMYLVAPRGEHSQLAVMASPTAGGAGLSFAGRFE